MGRNNNDLLIQTPESLTSKRQHLCHSSFARTGPTLHIFGRTASCFWQLVLLKPNSAPPDSA